MQNNEKLIVKPCLIPVIQGAIKFNRLLNLFLLIDLASFDFNLFRSRMKLFEVY